MARVTQEEARASARAAEESRSAAAAWSFDAPSVPAPPSTGMGGVVCVLDATSVLASAGRPGWTVGAAGRHSFRRFNAALDTTKAAAAIATGLAAPPPPSEVDEAEAVDEDEMLEAFMAMRQPGGPPPAKRRAGGKPEHTKAEHTAGPGRGDKRPKKSKKSRKGTKRPRE